MSTTRIDSGWIVSTRAAVALEPIFMINESMLVPSRPFRQNYTVSSQRKKVVMHL